MSASYQPVNTDDDTHSPEPLPEPKKPRIFSRRIVALFLAFCFVAFVSYKLGQWNVPSAVPEQALQSAAPEKPAVPSQDSASDSTGDQLEETPKPAENDTMSGKYSVGYFVNCFVDTDGMLTIKMKSPSLYVSHNGWGIYGRKYPPSLIPAQDLTHILYAFANIRQDTGEVFLSDLWADQDIHYPGDSWNDAGTNLYGNFKALHNLKQQNRHLKVLLSIGGWSYSAAFHPVVVNPTLRSKFVASAVALLENYGLDGLDVDYEYPQNESQARGYVELLRELRAGLDAHAQRKGADYRFLLTIAAPCGPDNYQKLFVREMDQSLDFWNLMAYDFSGSWDQIANHQANIHGPPISASQAVSFYTNAGVPRAKLILGVPLYGRSFLNTAGPGTPFSGLGQGSWEQGVYDYRALPQPGAHVQHDNRALASWSYDPATREMVSFDDAHVGRWKGAWIAQEGLGGSMFWELSGDKGTRREGMEGGHGKEEVPGESLVRAVKDAMGGLDMSPNWLRYEGSKFENMRNGMQ